MSCDFDIAGLILLKSYKITMVPIRNIRLILIKNINCLLLRVYQGG